MKLPLHAATSPLKIIETLEPGVVILRPDLSVQFVDRATLRILGGPPANHLFSQPVTAIHGEQTNKRLLDLVRQTRESQRPVPLSLKMVDRSGEDRFLLVKLLPLLDGDMSDQTLCALFYDITELVAEEHRLVRIPAVIRDEIQLLKPEDITFVRAANIYSEVGTASGLHHCDLSLGALEKRLPSDSFFRIHRSYLVNIMHIRRVSRDRLGCVVPSVEGEIHLPVSRDRSGAFMSRLGLR